MSVLLLSLFSGSLKVTLMPSILKIIIIIDISLYLYNRFHRHFTLTGKSYKTLFKYEWVIESEKKQQKEPLRLCVKVFQ